MIGRFLRRMGFTTTVCFLGYHFYGVYGSIGTVKPFCQRCGHVKGERRFKATAYRAPSYYNRCGTCGR